MKRSSLSLLRSRRWPSSFLLQTCATITCSFIALLSSSCRAFDPGLLERAAAVRSKLDNDGLPVPSLRDADVALFYPSAYTKPGDGGERGFCNWLLPGTIMVGQYPGQTPERDGPSEDDVRQHIQSMVRYAGIDLFCCLQSEVPCQSDSDAWKKANGSVYLDYQSRSRFPNPFTHYAPLVQSYQKPGSNGPVRFVRAPTTDLSVPDAKETQSLLNELLGAIAIENRTIYLHCWGGRGRAGTIGACLLSLIYPELDADAVLDLVDAGYNTRAGADRMPPQLSVSPQTTNQRRFVRSYVRLRQRFATQKK